MSYLIPQLLVLVMSAGVEHVFDARTVWKVYMLYVCMTFQMALVYIGNCLNATMQRDLTQLQSDVAELKTDVAELKTDVAELKTDVAELKTDMRRLVHYLLPDEALALPSQSARNPVVCEVDTEKLRPVRRQRAPVDEDNVEAVVDDVLDLIICDIEEREQKDARLCELVADTRKAKHVRDTEIELESSEALRESIADWSPLTRRKPFPTGM
jgi:uncharacterized coiled-coil protein SlyX